MGAGGQAVEDLHDGDDGQDVGDEVDDLLVVGEQEGQLEAEGAEDDEVEDADE